MEENIFKKARLKAAKEDNRFKTAEAAAELLNISRERLYMIEQENPKKRRQEPTALDVVNMARVYNAPELCDFFCTHYCPIEMGSSPLMYSNLGEISAKLMASLHFLDNINDNIHGILADSRISENEKAEFKRIIQTLRELSYSADSLELWAKRNGFIE